MRHMCEMAHVNSLENDATPREGRSRAAATAAARQTDDHMVGTAYLIDPDALIVSGLTEPWGSINGTYQKRSTVVKGEQAVYDHEACLPSSVPNRTISFVKDHWRLEHFPEEDMCRSSAAWTSSSLEGAYDPCPRHGRSTGRACVNLWRHLREATYVKQPRDAWLTRSSS